MKKNKKAFTLIELVAVIVILVILMIIAVPMANKHMEKTKLNAFLKEANTFARGAMQKEAAERDTNFKIDDIFHDTIDGKVCYSISQNVLSKYVTKTKNTYKGSVEVCYGIDCEYLTKIWITDGKHYIDGLTDPKELNQISNTFTTDYPESCGVRAIGGGTNGDLLTAEFEYTGKESEMYILIDGVYSLEVWGAQGGEYGSLYYGGYGAYAYGEVELKKGDKIYVNVGQKGSNYCPDADTCYAAYNGGARGNRYLGGGGGATHIANRSGFLYNVNEGNVFIIAGGGSGGAGAGDCTHNGNHAGGYSVYLPTGSCYSSASNSGRYGNYGGIPPTNMGCRGSGAGYGSCHHNKGYNDGNSRYGWGRLLAGTSFIGNPRLKNGAMYCMDCGNNSNVTTKTIQNGLYSEEPLPQHSKLGDGYAKITYIGEFTEE